MHIKRNFFIFMIVLSITLRILKLKRLMNFSNFFLRLNVIKESNNKQRIKKNEKKNLLKYFSYMRDSHTIKRKKKNLIINTHRSFINVRSALQKEKINKKSGKQRNPNYDIN